MHWLREEAEQVLWICQDTPGYTVASSAQQHSLVLLDVGQQHQGTYTCIASNAAGQALCSASLHVSGSEWAWALSGDGRGPGLLGTCSPFLGPYPALCPICPPQAQDPGASSHPCPMGSTQQAKTLWAAPITLNGLFLGSVPLWAGVSSTDLFPSPPLVGWLWAGLGRQASPFLRALDG